MLREIRCARFRLDSIRFSEGLNVVLGDANATNSIGKSSLLMVIDFVLGGESLLKHNTDIVEELGHHHYEFCFEFDGEAYRFRRGTSDHDEIYRCDSEYQPTEVISRSEFTAWLKSSYRLELPGLSFRPLISLYCRIWGKSNLDVHKPLHSFPTQSASECVNNLIKTFGRFSEIEKAKSRLDRAESRKAARNAAVRASLAPRVKKADYMQNAVSIAGLESELASSKADLAQYATNLSDLVSREVLDLKLEKDALIRVRTSLEGRLRRSRREVQENRHIRSKHFAGLLELFPEIDQERLASIEEFHSGLAKVLGAELREEIKRTEAELERVRAAIGELDQKMRATLNSIDEPTHLVDRVYKVATKLKQAREENQFYEGELELRRSLVDLREELSKVRRLVVAEIEKTLNEGMREIVSTVFGPDRKSPTIQLGETSYSFEVFEDTGTGTAFASLLLFDLTVLRETELPLLIHDSLLFKNVENDSVAKLLDLYPETEKQSFIAIDEIGKYGDDAAAFLRKRAAVQLDNDNLLYDKDWRVGS